MVEWNFGPGNSQFPIRLATVLLTCLVGVSTAAAPAASALAFSRDTPVETLCARVESALVARDFDSLESAERAMRDPNLRLAGGNSQLYHYYGALADFSGRGLFSCTSQLSFDQKRQFLEQWAAAMPRSVAAHIALSQLWTNAGWDARGDNYRDQVTDEQWNTLATDLAAAKSALAGIEGRADPHLYYVATEIARGQPDPRPVLDKIYAAAVKAFPSYFHYYSQRVSMLQERWYGEPGELRTYSATLLQSPGGDAGLVAYSYVAYGLMQSNERSTLLQTTGLSWPIVKSSYARREKLYGLRNRDWNALLNLSLAAVDPSAAKDALGKIAGQWDPVIWKERQYFDYAVSWTVENSGRPAP